MWRGSAGGGWGGGPLGGLPGAGAGLENARGPAVFVVSASRASLRQVQRGGTYQGSVEIVDGLAPGDTVVVAGSATLRDGTAVRIVNPPLRDAPPGLVPEGTPATMPANGGVR